MGPVKTTTKEVKQYVRNVKYIRADGKKVSNDFLCKKDGTLPQKKFSNAHSTVGHENAKADSQAIQSLDRKKRKNGKK